MLKMTRFLVLQFACGLLLALSQQAEAQIRISGFGQIVGSQQGGDGNYPTLGYTDDDLDFRTESTFAVQVSGDLNDQFSATAQVLARGSDDFDPEFAWAYLSWQANDSLSFKAGRQRIPFFVYSDYLDVGYAYPWIRPSQSTYYFAIQNYDGISGSWTQYSGDWSHRVELHIGRYNGDLFLAGQRADGEILGLAFGLWEATYDDWLTLRAAYGQGDISIVSPVTQPLFDGLGAAGLLELREQLDASEDQAQFTGLAINIDRGNWLAGIEATRVEIADAFSADTDQLFIHAGYRFGNLMPFVTYSTRDVDPRSEIFALIPAALPAPLAGAIRGLVLSEERDETYNSVGLRWDFMKNVAFKFEFRDYDSDVPTRPDAHVSSAAVVFTF